MEVKRRNRNLDLDWYTVGAYLALVLIGWLAVYASNYEESGSNAIFDMSKRHGKQLIYIGISLFAAFSILLIDSGIYTRFAYFIYGFFFLSLIAVLFLGAEVKGARSWFRFGGFGIQPAEFMKFATALAVAKFLSGLNVKVKDFRVRMITYSLLLMPMFMVIIQNDLGSALAFTGFIFILYRAGFNVNFVLIGGYIALIFIFSLMYPSIYVAAVLTAILLLGFWFWRKFLRKNRSVVMTSLAIYAFSIFFVMWGSGFVFDNLQPHHKVRVNSWLGIEKNKRDADYQVYHAKLAIGSGGFAGKGYLNGALTKGDHVPDQSTDFIFSTIGEEFGFIGSFVFIGLFGFLLLRISVLAERQRSRFSSLYAYGVCGLFFVHFTINVGSVLGLFPVTGIPLPFISYGGSGTIAFSILLFILIKLDSDRLFILR